MKPTLVIRPPYQGSKFPTWNDMNRLNRANPKKGARAEKQYREDLGFMIRAARPPKYSRQVRIGFIFFEPDNRRDPDNIQYFLKPFLDALQDCAVIPNDSRRYIRGFWSDFETDSKDPRIEVYISEVTE